MRAYFFLRLLPLIAPFISSLLLTACSSPQVVKLEDKVLPYDFSLEDQKPSRDTFLARFSQSDKTLDFLATAHVEVQPGKSTLAHPTFRKVRETLAQGNYDLVVVEGVEIPQTNQFSNSLQEKVASCVKSHFEKGCGESLYTIHLAQKRNISVISGEPPHAILANDLRRQDYTTEDLLGFYAVRKTPSWKRQGEVTTATSYDEYGKLVEGALVRYREQLAYSGGFTFSDFETWYARRVSLPQSPLDLTNQDAAPHGGEDATYLQKLSSAVCLARDRHLVNLIASSLEQSKRVLVVYGASHYLTELPALVSLLGQPTVLP